MLECLRGGKVIGGVLYSQVDRRRQGDESQQKAELPGAILSVRHPRSHNPRPDRSGASSKESKPYSPSDRCGGYRAVEPQACARGAKAHALYPQMQGKGQTTAPRFQEDFGHGGKTPPSLNDPPAAHAAGGVFVFVIG